MTDDKPFLRSTLTGREFHGDAVLTAAEGLVAKGLWRREGDTYVLTEKGKRVREQMLAAEATVAGHLRATVVRKVNHALLNLFGIILLIALTAVVTWGLWHAVHTPVLP